MTAKTQTPDYDKAEAAWLEAKEATEKAKEAVLTAKQNVREAEADLLKARDAERALWVAMRDAQWEHTYSKKGEWLGMQLQPRFRREA